MPAAPLTGLVVALDEACLDDTVAVMEVLIQEGFTTVCLPVGHPELAAVAGLYGARARLGCHGHAVDTAAVAGLGLSFALLDSADTLTLAALATAGVAAYPSAMTPNEVRQALAMPVSGVQLYPADVVGPSMAERLATIGLVQHVVPRGGILAYAAKQWLRAGAPAVCIDSHLLGDSLRGGDLVALRDRCRSFR